MMETNWWIIGIIGLLSSAAVVGIVLLINTIGRRAQAIAWLPVGLASTLAIQYNIDANSKDEDAQLNNMLKAAYCAQIISASFIIVFYIMVQKLVPDKGLNKMSPDEQNMALITAIVLALTGSVSIAVSVATFANPVWCFYVGTIGVVSTVYFLKFAPVLAFEKQEYSLTCKTCKKDCTIKCAEVKILIFSAMGTFIFILIPGLLSHFGLGTLAGIVANMPKITIVVMFELWFQRNDVRYTKHELNEHLTMFGYSICLTTVFLSIMWFNQNESKPEDFWGTWTASLALTFLIITALLLPLWCLSPSKSEESSRHGYEPIAAQTVPMKKREERILEHPSTLF
jgi:hypothetical protein